MLDILFLFFREFRLDFYRIVKNRPKPLSVLRLDTNTDLFQTRVKANDDGIIVTMKKFLH